MSTFIQFTIGTYINFNVIGNLSCVHQIIPFFYDLFSVFVCDLLNYLVFTLYDTQVNVFTTSLAILKRLHYY